MLEKFDFGVFYDVSKCLRIIEGFDWIDLICFEISIVDGIDWSAMVFVYDFDFLSDFGQNGVGFGNRGSSHPSEGF